MVSIRSSTHCRPPNAPPHRRRIKKFINPLSRPLPPTPLPHPQKKEEKKKWEPPAPPPRVGRKNKKAKDAGLGAKLPAITPNARCKLRMLKLERVKDYLLLEEEFVKNQELLKPMDQRDAEDRTKVDEIRGFPLSVGTLEEIIDENHAIVSSSVGPEYYVTILSIVRLKSPYIYEAELLVCGACVCVKFDRIFHTVAISRFCRFFITAGGQDAAGAWVQRPAAQQDQLGGGNPVGRAGPYGLRNEGT